MPKSPTKAAFGRIELLVEGLSRAMLRAWRPQGREGAGKTPDAGTPLGNRPAGSAGQVGPASLSGSTRKALSAQHGLLCGKADGLSDAIGSAFWAQFSAPAEQGI